MRATPARGRRKFPMQPRPRITYQLATEQFEYESGVMLSQDGGKWVVMTENVRETFADRVAARSRFSQLVRINKLLGK